MVRNLMPDIPWMRVRFWVMVAILAGSIALVLGGIGTWILGLIAHSLVLIVLGGFTIACGIVGFLYSYIWFTGG